MTRYNSYKNCEIGLKLWTQVLNYDPFGPGGQNRERGSNIPILHILRVWRFAIMRIFIQNLQMRTQFLEHSKCWPLFGAQGVKTGYGGQKCLYTQKSCLECVNWLSYKWRQILQKFELFLRDQVITQPQLPGPGDQRKGEILWILRLLLQLTLQKHSTCLKDQFPGIFTEGGSNIKLLWIKCPDLNCRGVSF